MNQLAFFEEAKTIAMMALASDDRLMEELVLKGGNALDIAYGVSTRASLDLDYSVSDDLGPADLLEKRMERVLATTFREHGHIVFDMTVKEVPSNVSDDVKDFWGGYKIEFKIATVAQFHEHGNDLATLRRNSAVVGESGGRKFKIDISKHEYCGDKRAITLRGLQVFVYSPAMIVCEKLRAICQQMPEYSATVHRERRPGSARSRDFVDIHTVCENLSVDVTSTTFESLLRQTFAAKRVPLGFLAKISDYRDFHRPDFASVMATVKAGRTLSDFDFYVDFVVAKCQLLEALWKE